MTIHDLRTFGHRLETTFVGRSVRRFMALKGIDRAVVLSSQAFTALIPLLLLVTALAPVGEGDAVAGAINRRFRLSGEAADGVNQLFAHSGNSSIGVLSVLLLVFSGVSLARRLQRMYQDAWDLGAVPPAGGALDAALGLVVLVLGISLLYLARTLVGSLPAGDVLVAPVSVVASFLVWTCVPWLLLHRRIAWRRLVPGGVLTATLTTVYGVASTLYMPPLFESYSERYGLFGVTLALIGWLLCTALIVVGATAVAAELDRTADSWAQHLRLAVRSVPAAVGGRPVEPPATRPVPLDDVLGPKPVDPFSEPRNQLHDRTP